MRQWSVKRRLKLIRWTVQCWEQNWSDEAFNTTSHRFIISTLQRYWCLSSKIRLHMKFFFHRLSSLCSFFLIDRHSCNSFFALKKLNFSGIRMSEINTSCVVGFLFTPTVKSCSVLCIRNWPEPKLFAIRIRIRNLFRFRIRIQIKKK